MHTKKRFKLKRLAINIAISFFFTSIFISIIYYLGNNKINYYAALINSTAVKEGPMVDAVYNKKAKRVVEFPSWGNKFAEIIIPKIDMNLPVYHGDNMKILRLGIGHYAGSYFPGEEGSIILAGHNNKGIFDRLGELEQGDKVVIKANYGTFTYKVSDKKVVDENDLDAFPVEHDYELLVMYTCWPIDGTYGRKTERLVVYATKVGESYE